VYAHRREARSGDAAFPLMRIPAEGDRAWAIPWPCWYEFLSVVTNRWIWKDGATPSGTAWQQMAAWMASPFHRMIGETADFADILSSFVQRPHVAGGVVHDARIAAICVAHGVDELLTRDRDFSMFPELRTRDPFSTRSIRH